MKMNWGAFRSATVLCSAAILGACGGDKSTQPQVKPAAAITAVSGTPQTAQAGEKAALPLTVKVADASGGAVPNALVTFTIASGGGTLNQALDTTDSQGNAAVLWTVGSSLGTGRVTARTTGVATTAAFDVTITAGPANDAQRVSSLIGTAAGGFDLADSVAIKIADKFGNPIANTSVAFAVTAGGGKVSPATKTTDDNGIARAAWTMGTSGTQTLRASTGAIETFISGTAQVCPETTLAVGQSLTIGVGAANCLIMAGTAQRYIVTVTNPTNSPTSSAAFRLRGAGSTTSSNTTPETPVISSARNLALQYAADVLGDEGQEEAAHRAEMNANYALMQRMSGLPPRRTANIAAQTLPPNVGDIVSFKIPKNFDNLCDAATSPNPNVGTASITARVLAVTAHAVVLEDTLAPRHGVLDTLYTKAGTEFENVMWPILTTNFGNPLAMDAKLVSAGKVYMVFSKDVNDMQGGNIAGFVSSSDFFDTAQCGSSNMRATFYAQVPTSVNTGFDQDDNTQTPEEWYHTIRTVIIHETKHVASFAEKLARSGNLFPANFFTKDQWLEEGSAMLAEELWARTVFGYAQRGNVNYLSSIYCEVRVNVVNFPECGTVVKPSSLIDHYFYLYNFEVNPEALSVVGPTSNTDFNFYGSGWMFLRWVVDQYSSSEPTFLTAMTSEIVAPGTDNIQIRTGKSFADLLGEFSLALALDDYPGFTPQNTKHSIPSWNTRNIFAGLSADFASRGFFTNAVPLKLRPASFGKFIIDVSSVHGGGISLMEVTGTQNAKQLFEFKGASGSDFPAEMRVNLVRIQ